MNEFDWGMTISFSSVFFISGLDCNFTAARVFVFRFSASIAAITCRLSSLFAAARVIGGGYEGGWVPVLSPVPPVSGYDAGRRHHVHHRRVRGRPHHHVCVTKDNGNILLKINTLPGCFCSQGQQQLATTECNIIKPKVSKSGVSLFLCLYNYSSKVTFWWKSTQAFTPPVRCLKKLLSLKLSYIFFKRLCNHIH